MKKITKKIAITTLLGVVVMNTSAFAADPTTPIGAYTFSVPAKNTAKAEITDEGILEAKQSGKVTVTIKRAAGTLHGQATAKFHFEFLRDTYQLSKFYLDYKKSYSYKDIIAINTFDVLNGKHKGKLVYSLIENTVDATINPQTGKITLEKGKSGTFKVVATLAKTLKYEKKILTSDKITISKLSTRGITIQNWHSGPWTDKVDVKKLINPINLNIKN